MRSRVNAGITIVSENPKASVRNFKPGAQPANGVDQIATKLDRLVCRDRVSLRSVDRDAGRANPQKALPILGRARSA